MRRLSPVAWSAVGLCVIAAAATAVWIWTNAADAWMPNVATNAIFVAITITVIDGVVRRRDLERSRNRIEQALRRVSGYLFTMADFVLWDYSDMHTDATYEEPPMPLRALLTHFKDGLETRDREWPTDLRFLAASKALANALDEQARRHDSVLEDTFIAASYDFIRAEMIGRNMYLDRRHHYDDNGWKKTALSSLADDVLRLLDVLEPYGLRYLGADSAPTLRDHDIEGIAFIRTANHD